MSWGGGDDSNPFAASNSGNGGSSASAGEAPPPSWLSAPPSAPAPAPPQASTRVVDTSGGQPAGQWNNGGGNAGAASGAAAAGSIGFAGGAAAGGPRTEDVEAGRRYHTYLRIANVLISVFVMIAAILALLTSSVSFAIAVVCLYAIVFAILLCCFETHIKSVGMFIEKNFGFMYDPYGRFLFLIFVGIVCLSFRDILGYIAGPLCVLSAFVATYLMCYYPTAFQEEKESLEAVLGRKSAGNPDMVLAAGSAGANWAAENPDQARRMAARV